VSELAPYPPRPEQLRYRSIRSVLSAVVALDLVMAAGKGLYGYLSGSLGMVSDGLHSALHASGGIIGLIGVSLAARPPDPDHPYGHERYEPLASMGIAAFMLAAFWKILESAWDRLRAPLAPRVACTRRGRGGNDEGGGTAPGKNNAKPKATQAMACAGSRLTSAAGIMWKSAPPTREPAANATIGSSSRCSVASLMIRVRLPVSAIALIRTPPHRIHRNVVMQDELGGSRTGSGSPRPRGPSL